METSLFYFSQSFCAVTSNITFSLAIKKRFPERFVIPAGWPSQEDVFSPGKPFFGWFLSSPVVTPPVKDKALLSPALLLLQGWHILTLRIRIGASRKACFVTATLFACPHSPVSKGNCCFSMHLPPAAAFEELHIFNDSSIHQPRPSAELTTLVGVGKQDKSSSFPMENLKWVWSPTKWSSTWISFAGT